MNVSLFHVVVHNPFIYLSCKFLFFYYYFFAFDSPGGLEHWQASQHTCCVHVTLLAVGYILAAHKMREKPGADVTGEDTGQKKTIPSANMQMM